MTESLANPLLSRDYMELKRRPHSPFLQ